uniref:RRM domain-containing protein n=1 Tax=Oryza rufipogon TaxID=4529 RepID=A0A0E0MWC5_ORYRU
MALDIEGNMVDLGQGLLTQGVTIGDLQEGIHHGADHLLPVIVIIHLEGRGHHLPTGRLDWVSLDGICFSYATTERDLEKKFSKYGRVTSARVVRDKRSGDSRGFGFLSLEKDEDADAAIRACDETEWNGRIILGPAADKRELIPFNVCNLCAQDVMPCQICTRRSSSSSWSPADLAKWLSSTALRGMNGIQICEALILNRLVDLPIIYSNVGSNHHVYICTFAR